jgi:peptidoglycan hydrolase-like protein with peptidoglycan-binding domain
VPRDAATEGEREFAIVAAKDLLLEMPGSTAGSDNRPFPVKNTTLLLCCALFLSAQTARGDEQTRQVQEELRKRHLFFSDIDGRATPDYSAALKRYQQRQGFAVTGVADEATLSSLGIGEAAPPGEGAPELPDVPVLKSDIAPHERNTASRPPAPTTPPNAPEVTQAEVRQFVRHYLDACASPNLQDELAFYSDQVDYFDHGVVDKNYIRNELAVYDQRWPVRTYSMGESLRLIKKGGDTTAHFRVAFQVANEPRARTARGRTDDAITLAKRSDSGVQIVSIKEARVRRSSRHRPEASNPAAAVGRTVHKIFRNIFH